MNSNNFGQSQNCLLSYIKRYGALSKGHFEHIHMESLGQNLIGHVCNETKRQSLDSLILRVEILLGNFRDFLKKSNIRLRVELIQGCVSSVLFRVDIRSHQLKNLSLTKVAFVSSLGQKDHDPNVPLNSLSIGTLLKRHSDFVELFLNQFSLIVDILAVSELFDKSGQFLDPKTLHYK